MGAGCALVTCAFKRKGLESCALCKESVACVLLRRHRESGKRHDSFVSYRRVEANAALIARHGIARFDRSQRARERLLRAMLRGYDDGRSKSRYCVAVTVLDGPRIERILRQAGAQSRGMDRSQKAALMREMLSAATAGAGGIGLRS